MDLMDLYRPGSGLGWRKLLTLIDHLPPEGALNTAIRNQTPEDAMPEGRDPAMAPWSALETMMALLIDEVRILAWMYQSKNSEASIPKPEPMRRPGIGRKHHRLRKIRLVNARRLDPRLRGLSDEDAQDKLDRMTGRG